MQNKKQSFIEGAFILVLAGLVVKIIGAFYKIPLQHLIGDDGMGWFGVAYQLYTAMFVISTAGIPAALSKMIAESNAVGRGKEISRTVRVATMFFLTIGALATAVLWFGAQPLTAFIGNPNAWYAVRAIAPSVFLVCIVSIFRGYYQGLSNMVPTAISQVIEAVCKLLLGYGFAYWVKQAGYPTELVAAASVAGVTVGEVFAAIFMLIRATLDRKHPPRSFSEDCNTRREILRTLLLIAVPITITSAVTSITTLVDTGMVMNRLQDAGFTAARANELFGIYNGKAFTMFNLPQTLITALSTSALPAIAGAYKQRNYDIATRTMGSAIRLAMLIALPAAVGYLTLATPIIDLLYSGDVEIAGGLLRILSLSIPLVALVGLSNAMLQAVGKVRVPMVTMLIGMMLKLVINFTLVGTEQINIYGAPIGTFMCYASIAIMNLYVLSKSIAMPKVGKQVGKTAVACVGMGAVASITYLLLLSLVGNSLAVLVAIALAAFTYLVLLLLLGGLLREDVLMMPAGTKLVRILRIKK